MNSTAAQEVCIKICVLQKVYCFFFGEKNSTALLRNMTIIEYRAGTVEYIQNRLFTAI